MNLPNPFKKKPRKKKESVGVPVVSKPVVPVEKEDHKHQWELTAKTYAPPTRDLAVKGAPTTATETTVFERIQFGVTTLLFQCALCKTFVKEEMLGSDIDTLDDMLEKAESYGPQLIQRPNNEVFIIQKYQNPNTIPVR